MASGDPFSLTSAVRSIAFDEGVKIDLDDLHAAMGLSLLVCSASDDSPPNIWPALARDIFLIEAGLLFGLTIRQVHPPAAARGLNQSSEFRQHFDASYSPLVRHALNNGQRVLAWQGWSNGGDFNWGIISRGCESGVGFAGTVARPASVGPGSIKAVLLRPPVQLYIVETLNATNPPPDDLLALALDHARRALDGEEAERFGVTMGPGAYDVWIDRLANDERSPAKEKASSTEREPSSEKESQAGHAAFAESIAAGHESMLRFLRRHRPAGKPTARGTVDELEALCEDVVRALAGAVEPGCDAINPPSPRDAAAFVSRPRVAQDACTKIHDCLRAISELA